MGPQIATNCGMSKRYLSTIVPQRISSPQPTTNAAIRYRLNAARIFGDIVPAACPAAGLGVAVMSPAGSTGTTAVLLCQGGERLVVRGQFGVVGIVLRHGGDAQHDPFGGPLTILAVRTCDGRLVLARRFGRPGTVRRRHAVHSFAGGRPFLRRIDLREQFAQLAVGLLVVLGLLDLLQA